MAQVNYIVVGLCLVGLTLDLINIVLFGMGIPFWFGYIWDVFGIIFTIVLLVQARCIQNLFYRDQFVQDQMQDQGGVIEIITKRSETEE